jgi:hypothetical protein
LQMKKYVLQDLDHFRFGSVLEIHLLKSKLVST